MTNREPSTTDQKAMDRDPQFVGLFDILGFRQLIRRRGEEWLENRVRALLKIAPATGVAGWASKGFFLLPGPGIGYNVFSDTILTWSIPGTVCEDFYEACNLLMMDALALDLPLRGGIAFGHCVLDTRSSIFLGQPIVDAYEIEQSQEWIGASFHVSCQDGDQALAYGGRGMTDWWAPCKVPVKHNAHPDILPIALSGWIQNIRSRRKLETLRRRSPKGSKIKYDEALRFAQDVGRLASRWPGDEAFAGRPYFHPEP